MSFILKISNYLDDMGGGAGYSLLCMPVLTDCWLLVLAQAVLVEAVEVGGQAGSLGRLKRGVMCVDLREWV